MKHRHRLAQRQRQRSASPSRRAEVYEETDEQPSSSAGKPKSALRIRCARKVERPSRASTNSVVVDGRATATTTVGPPVVLLDLLEAPMIREEKSLRRTGSARALSAGYKTNCSAQSRPTSAVADRGSGIRRWRLIDDSDVAPSAGGSSLGSGFGSALSSFGDGLSAIAKARGSGPPPVPVPSSTAAQANDPGFIRQQQSAQKSQAVLARIKALESAGQKSMTPGQPKIPGNKTRRPHPQKPQEQAMTVTRADILNELAKIAFADVTPAATRMRRHRDRRRDGLRCLNIELRATEIDALIKRDCSNLKRVTMPNQLSRRFMRFSIKL